MADEAAFQIAPALLAGLISTVVFLIAVMVMLAVLPTRFPLNPLFLIGSSFSIDTTAAYIAGLGTVLLSGIGYGIVVSAVLTGFQVSGLEPLWGAAAGFTLSIVSGTTFAYSRSLNRHVRTGYVGDPGPFLLRYGGLSVAQLVIAHVLFGALVTTLYTAFA